jgi:presenilin-like A22 family membrane protease
MKHKFKYTGILLLWLFALVVGGLLIAPTTVKKTSEVLIDPIFMILFFIIIMLVSAVAWLFILRRKWKGLEYAFAVPIGAIWSRFIDEVLIPPVPYWWIDVIIRTGIFLIIMFAYLAVVRRMRRSWDETLKWAKWSNVLMLTSITCAAVFIAAQVSPLTAIIILCLVGIYDAIAVWKLKTMQEMATKLLDQRIFPGITVPYKDMMDKYAMLGAGDVFFIVLVAVSFYKTWPPMMWITAIAMVIPVVLLFLFSKKDTSYPAIPFICIGLFVGLGVGWMVL